MHTLSLKEGFFVGIYKKKGLGLLGHKRKKETIELHVRLFLGHVYSQTVVEHYTASHVYRHFGRKNVRKLSVSTLN